MIAWLDEAGIAQMFSDFPARQQQLSPANTMVVQMYNAMRGIDWQALPWLLALYGVEDLELTVSQLLLLRDRLLENRGGEDE